MLKPEQAKIAVVGLGYVGLPLAAAFGKVMPTVGFDINPARVDELRAGRDRTLEVEPGALAEAVQLSYSSESGDIVACNVFIVAVPTPVDCFNRPDLGPLEVACGLVGASINWSGSLFGVQRMAALLVGGLMVLVGLAGML
ncbi:MAG: hypothetical protein ACWGNB_09860, partial [Thiogranum sp.]